MCQSSIFLHTCSLPLPSLLGVQIADPYTWHFPWPVACSCFGYWEALERDWGGDEGRSQCIFFPSLSTCGGAWESIIGFSSFLVQAVCGIAPPSLLQSPIGQLQLLASGNTTYSLCTNGSRGEATFCYCKPLGGLTAPCLAFQFIKPFETSALY